MILNIKKWHGDNLWYLMNLEMPELVSKFPEYSKETLSRTRRKYNNKIQSGIVEMPPAPNGSTPTYSGLTADKKIINNVDRAYLHRLLDETLDETNINPSHVSKLRVTAGTHEGYIKNANNEIEYTKELRRGGINLIIEPERFKAKWDVIQQAPALINKVEKYSYVKNGKQKVCVVLPDPQIGYRRFVDGSMEPFHDEKAISIALQVINDLKPDKVVCLGDYLDLPMFGRFEQSEDYAHTAQLAINYGHKLLAKIRLMVPKAEIVVIEGNHDRRIQNSINNSNMSAFGIRRADDTTGWPVFSVPYLLNFDALNIIYTEGYPAGKYWINERLQCIHGHVVGPAGQTAAKVVKMETSSTIFGHIHRIETAYDTQNTFNGGRANLAHSPGALCRIDGGVPSAKGSTSLDGRAIKSYENWQHGLAIVDYEDGDAPFSLHSVYINTFQGYKTVVNGKMYLPDLSILK